MNAAIAESGNADGDARAHEIAMGLDRAQRERAERQRAADLSRPVERAASGVGRFGEGAGGQSEGCSAERHDDNEHAAPAKSMDERAAERRPDREPEAIAAGPDAERSPALRRVGPRDPQGGERSREQQRRPQPGQRSSRQQYRYCRRHGADHRCHGENGGAGHEDPSPTHEIGEQASRQQHRGVNEIVAVDDPLQGAETGVEVLSDRLHGEIRDRRVELRDQHGRAKDRQRQAVARLSTSSEGAISRKSWRIRQAPTLSAIARQPTFGKSAALVHGRQSRVGVDRDGSTPSEASRVVTGANFQAPI